MGEEKENMGEEKESMDHSHESMDEGQEMMDQSKVGVEEGEEGKDSKEGGKKSMEEGKESMDHSHEIMDHSHESMDHSHESMDHSPEGKEGKGSMEEITEEGKDSKEEGKGMTQEGKDSKDYGGDSMEGAQEGKEEGKEMTDKARESVKQGNQVLEEGQEGEEDGQMGMADKRGKKESTEAIMEAAHEGMKSTMGVKEEEREGMEEAKTSFKVKNISDGDECLAGEDFAIDMDLHEGLSTTQNQFLELSGLEEEHDRFSCDDESHRSPERTSEGDADPLAPERTLASPDIMDRRASAHDLFPVPLDSQVPSLTMAEEQPALDPRDLPDSAYHQEHQRSLDVLEITLSEHSDGEQEEQEHEPLSKTVGRIKRRKTESLASNRMPRSNVDKGVEEDAGTSVLKPSRTYKKAAARGTKVKKTHKEEEEDESEEATRLMIVKAELNELKDPSRELVSLELSEVELMHMLYPRSSCGWNISGREEEAGDVGEEENRSASGSHAQTCRLSSLGQDDALCNKLLETAKQHVADLDLKKCNISYKWDENCIYMGVLGGKNNSQKYLSSDQAWYHVTWDDGSKAQVLLETHLCNVALKEHHRSILRDKEPKSWCLDPPSVVQRFFTLVLQETSEKSPVPRGNAFQAYEGFNSLANDAAGERLKGRKQKQLNDKDATEALVLPAVKQEGGQDGDAGALVPVSQPPAPPACRSEGISGGMEQALQVTGSSPDGLTEGGGERGSGEDAAGEDEVMLGEFLSLSSEQWEEPRKRKKHCEICRSKEAPLEVCRCGLTVHLNCYLGDFLDKEASIRAVAQVGFKCDPCCYDIEQENRSCALCPQGKLGALRPTSDGRWAHITCARFLPELKIGRDEISGLDQLDRSRWSHVCYLCGTKSGWCLTCQEETCLNPFHAGCALRLTKRSLSAVMPWDAAGGKISCGGHPRKK